MKKFMIMMAIGLLLALGAGQVAAKAPFPNLVGAKFIGTGGSFADATTGTFFNNLTLELDVAAQQDNLFIGTLLVDIAGTPTTVPVAGQIDHKEVTLAGSGFTADGELHTVKGAVVLSLQFLQTGTAFPRVGIGTFDLVKQ